MSRVSKQPRQEAHLRPPTQRQPPHGVRPPRASELTEPGLIPPGVTCNDVTQTASSHKILADKSNILKAVRQIGTPAPIPETVQVQNEPIPISEQSGVAGTAETVPATRCQISNTKLQNKPIPISGHSVRAVQPVKLTEVAPPPPEELEHLRA